MVINFPHRRAKQPSYRKKKKKKNSVPFVEPIYRFNSFPLGEEIKHLGCNDYGWKLTDRIIWPQKMKNKLVALYYYRQIGPSNV